MSKFAVGESAIFVRPERAYKYEGQIVVIIALPRPEEWDASSFGQSWNAGWKCGAERYLTRALDGNLIGLKEYQLRKLPGDERKDFIPPEVRKLFIPSKEKSHV